MKAGDAIEEAFAAPAQALEEGIEVVERVEAELVNKRPLKAAEEYLGTLGPGLVTGAADDDCSGIATYSQAGAGHGFTLLWLAPFSFPLMATVQEMCARIGIVTGEGLAANIRARYPRGVLLVLVALLFAANTFNLGADLGAMGKATQLLLPRLPFGLIVIAFALLILLLQIFTTYARYAKYLKYLTLSLLSYIGVALMVQIDWAHVAYATFVPTFSWGSGEWFLVCAILGTTISPYLFFWQTSQEVEEMVLKGQSTLAERRASPNELALKRMRVDTWTGMFFSNAVMFFIIVACAATLGAAGITNIATADQAATALRPLAGDFAYLLFTLGILGTGLLAIPTLAGSASYAISESFAWDTGLYRKLKEAYAFYGVIIIAMLVGLALNFIGLDPIKALLYSAVANGVVAPIVLYFIVRISSNGEVMGAYANGPVKRTLGWLTILLMAVAGVAALYSIFA